MYRTIFFLKRDNVYNESVYAIKNCKRPNATKVCKELEEMFNNGEIVGYGWKREQENN